MTADPSVSVLSEVACELGEGPTYDPSTDTLFWFDIVDRKLHEHRFSDGTAKAHDLPVMASALAAIDGARQLLWAEDGLYVREAATGRLTLHMAVEADNPVTRSNDARVHPSGAFWISTMGRKAETEAGSIYWYRKGQLRLLFSKITVPNAISFSPDGGTAYLADSHQGDVLRVEVEPRTGLPLDEPKTFIERRRGSGSPDGAVVDAEGVFWSARWGAGLLQAYSPAGDLLQEIRVPARQVTCPAFVGLQAERLAVTSAWEGLSPEKRAEDPKAGFTFLVDLPVRGRLEPRVLL